MIPSWRFAGRDSAAEAVAVWTRACPTMAPPPAVDGDPACPAPPPLESAPLSSLELTTSASLWNWGAMNWKDEAWAAKNTPAPTVKAVSAPARLTHLRGRVPGNPGVFGAGSSYADATTIDAPTSGATESSYS